MLQPSIIPPPRRRALLVGLVGLVAVAGLAVTWHMWAADDATGPAVIIVPPAVVTVVPPPPPPAPPSPPPAPPPVATAEPAPAPPIRAARPHLDAACIGVELGEAPPECDWDHGFPAVSEDGALVVSRVIPEDGGRGNPGLELHYLDARTGRAVRTVSLLSPDEWETVDHAKLQGIIAARTAKAQRELDARWFRTLDDLGELDAYDDHVTTDPARIHAEFAHDQVRIVDPATRTALWQGTLSATGPRLRDDCGGWGMRRLAVWWDRATGVIYAASAYDTGGCMCPTLQFEHVAHVR